MCVQVYVVVIPVCVQVYIIVIHVCDFRCTPLSYLCVQVYTVGPDYAHAEARKSPALDGKVERNKDGKEIRYPVLLSAKEKLIARTVCLAFKVHTRCVLTFISLSFHVLFRSCDSSSRLF